MQKDTTTNSASSNTSINIDISDANDESLQKRDKTPLKLSENPPDSDNKTDNGVGVMCPSCKWSETLVEVERVEGALEVHLEKLPMDNNEEGRLMAEEILSRWEAAKLHPHHHILMAAKRKVALSPAGLGTLGNHANEEVDEFDQNTIAGNSKQLNRKVELCDEVRFGILRNYLLLADSL